MPRRVVRYKPQIGQFPSTKIAKRFKKGDRAIKKFKKEGELNELFKARLYGKQ